MNMNDTGYMIKNLIIAAALLVTAGTACSQNLSDMRSKHPAAKDNDHGEYRISRSDSEWKDILDPLQYEILRRSGTERAFTGELYDNRKPGIYYSAATGQPLFASDSKFDSGCGWPSFFEPITEGVILYRTDRSHGMIRTEIIDSSSGSHLGHVFDDGPPPTGLRYCMNSAAMIFVSADEEPHGRVKDYMENHASEEERMSVKRFLDSRK